MKKYLFLLVGLCMMSFVHAQEQEEKGKGSYLSVSGSVGSSSFKYKLESLSEKGSRSNQMGYGVDLKYTYMFDFHWGISTGVGISHYGSKGKLKGSLDEDTYFKFEPQTDNDEEGRPRNFELRARLKNLEEKQTAYFVEVPVLFSYQTWFGEQRRWGVYGGVGAKFQFPVSAKFRIQNGGQSELNISGYYKGIPTDMGSPANPPVPQHGYGTISDPNKGLNWDNKMKFKMGIAGTAEFGFMLDLGKGTDLLIGGYIDYGFNNIKKRGNRQLLSAPNPYHPESYTDKTPYIGKGISYNGMLNSNVTNKINLVSFGAKVGFRFKM